MKLEFRTFAQVTKDHISHSRLKMWKPCPASQPAKPKPAARALWPQVAHPALSQLQRLSGKRGQGSKDRLRRGEEVTPAAPGTQPGAARSRLGSTAWITAWSRAGGVWVGQGHTSVPEVGPLDSGAGEARRTKKKKSRVSDGPWNPGSSPSSVPWGGCYLGPVTHSDTTARTKAIATAQLEGLRTSWASSAALRHASGTSWGRQAGYLRPKAEGVGGWRSYLRAAGARQRLPPARKRRNGGWGARERPWPRPLLAPRRGGGVAAPRPSPVHMLAEASQASESLDTPGEYWGFKGGCVVVSAHAGNWTCSCA